MEVNSSGLNALAASRPDAATTRRPDPEQPQTRQAVAQTEELERPRQRPEGPRGQNLDITA
jgi:hypothetical protein